MEEAKTTIPKDSPAAPAPQQVETDKKQPVNIFAIKNFNAETPVEIEKEEDLEEATKLIETAKIADDDVGELKDP